jgi:hypothetical protein
MPRADVSTRGKSALVAAGRKASEDNCGRRLRILNVAMT